MAITHWGFTITNQGEQVQAAFVSADEAITALQVAVAEGWYVDEVHKWYSLPLSAVPFDSVGDFIETLDLLGE